MAEQRGCPTCRHDHLDADEEPCIKCRYVTEPQDETLDDMYEPMPKPTKADEIRNMSDDELTDFLVDFRNKGIDEYCDFTTIVCWGVCPYNHACQDNPKELIKMFLQKERKVD